MSSQDLKAAVRKMAHAGGFDATIDRAVVLEVDKNEVTCTVQLIADDSILEGVKLKPVINDGDTKQMGLIMYPAINSFVIIGQVDKDNTDLFVLGMTNVESIVFDTDTPLQINLNAVQMVFNNGDNGGIPLLKPLVAAIANLQQQHNKLRDAYEGHVHAGVQTGSGTSLTTAQGPPAAIDPILKESDIANPKISQ